MIRKNDEKFVEMIRKNDEKFVAIIRENDEKFVAIICENDEKFVEMIRSFFFFQSCRKKKIQKLCLFFVERFFRNRFFFFGKWQEIRR